MSHRNARLNEYARLLLVRRIEQGHSKAEVAKQLGVSRPTVHKWWNRYLDEGVEGLQDRSSQPHHSPRRISRDTVRRIVAARLLEFAGPIALSGILDLPASTIGLVIRREGLPRLADIDRITGEVIRGRRHSGKRYEHSEPGSLLHVDVKKLGKIPPGGGWRVHGRSEAVRSRGAGYDYVHVAVDDRTRLAYAEVLPNEKSETCAAFLHRAAEWFKTRHGVTVRRVLTDNAKVYRHGQAWAAVCSTLQIRRLFTKVRCPWTNGKAERFNRTLLTEWAYAKAWTSNDRRAKALASYLQHYNTRRSHSALGGRPPITRLAA